MRIVLHKHHVKPRHIGGTDADGVILCTPAVHAYFHRVLYAKYGRWQDRVAYKGLAANPEFWDERRTEIRRAGGRASKTCPARVAKLMSRSYRIIDPEGVEVTITNLTAFCKREGYNRNTFICFQNKGRPNLYGFILYNIDYDVNTGLRTCE